MVVHRVIFRDNDRIKNVRIDQKAMVTPAIRIRRYIHKSGCSALVPVANP